MAGRECYRQAKITNPLKEIQVAELYDPFSGMQFPKLEALGFCKPGEAARLSDDGAFDMNGVTGLVRHADAAKQVMRCAGAMQVPNVQRALATAVGGSAQFWAVSVLGADVI